MNIALAPQTLSTQPATALVVIDSHVDTPQSLVAGVRSGVAALLLDPNQDGVAQITAALTTGSYTSLHLVAHGSPGALQLGSGVLSLATLPAYRQQLLEWGVAEVLVYGCNVAAEPELLRALHQLIGAAVAASGRPVGRGNWVLEWQVGAVRSASAFTPELEQAYQGTFPDAEFNLSDLDGSNGFVLNGVDAGDGSGRSVSNAGDVNGDGVDDLIISARSADPNDQSNAGESYVVFGGANVGSSGSLDLSDLNGSNGFVLNGVDRSDFSGSSVSGAGDVNGDGIDDLIIGARSADPNGQRSAGESYVVFGGASVGSSGSLNLGSLNGNNGFVLNGVDQSDLSGNSVSGAGDVNGDGIDDLIIGAQGADPNGQSGAGESYVVFGGANVGSSGSLNLSSLNGSNGLVLNGVGAFNGSGISVSDAGDVNGDGIDDLIIGAQGADPNGQSGAGESYVVFGGTNIGGNGRFNLGNLNGNNGFVLSGIDSDDRSGFSVSSAGDVNGDGIADLIIGAYNADPNSEEGSGESYVIFGGTNLGSNGSLELNTLNGSNGFVLNGVDASDQSGYSVSSAGDVNGDGIDDVIIGALGAEPGGKVLAGASYIIFGGSSVGSQGSIELSSLDGSNGFVVNGVDASDRVGLSVSSAGDVNGDGLDDVIIGAFGASPNGQDGAGESYVVFGVGSPNAAPTFTSLPTVTVSENQFSVINVNATDDNNTEGDGLSYTISGGDDAALFEIDALTGELSFITAPDFETPGDVDADNLYAVQVAVTDAGGLQTTQDLTITVTDEFEDNAPIILSTSDVSAPENQTNVIDLTAADDLDSEGAGLTYSITGGTDAARFAIDAVTGELSFIAAPDFENPGDADADNIYNVQVTVTDTGDLSDVQDLAVTVTDGNDKPTIVTSSNASVVEDQTTVLDIDANDDLNGEGTGLTYSITGGDDAALFNINATTGDLSFITAPDFENPSDAGADNTYNLQVTVADASGLTDVQELTIAVTNGNDKPTITSAASITVPENQKQVADIDTADDFSGEGAGLTYSITGGDDASSFIISSTTGELSFRGLNGQDFEDPEDLNGDNIYNLQVTVTDESGLTDVQDLAISVTDGNDKPEVVEVDTSKAVFITVKPLAETTFIIDPVTQENIKTLVSLTPHIDGPGLAYQISGGNDAGLFEIDSVTGIITPIDSLSEDRFYDVEVLGVDINGAKIWSTYRFDRAGDGTIKSLAVGSRNVNAVDDRNSEGAGLAYSISGGDDAALFEIDPVTGVISFINNPNQLAAGIYDLEVTVTDEEGLTDVITYPFVFTRALEPDQNPVILSTDTVTVPENQTEVIDMFTVYDPDGGNNDLAYSISGGEDAALFDIDAVTGLVTFKTAPDFEAPQDMGADNIYQLRVTVTDSNGRTDSQDLTITVEDVETVTLLGTSQADLLIGGDEDDVIQGLGDNDELVGGAGNDTIWGGEGNDALYGQSGDDYLNGGTGNDILNGGTGNDELFGGEGNDGLRGGDGDDLLDGGVGKDVLIAGDGNDTLLGGADNDLLYGDAGDDLLNGGEGDDILRGGIGDDDLLGGAGDDILNGENGNDDLFGDEGDDRLRGGNGDDLLDGGVGEDVLLAGAGNDTLLGGADDDLLYGDGGDDLLNGGLGNDYLHGNQGADIYVLEVGAGFDTFAGFVLGEDRIGLAGGLSFGQLEISQVGGSAQISAFGESLATVRWVGADDLIAAADTAFTVV